MCSDNGKSPRRSRWRDIRRERGNFLAQQPKKKSRKQQGACKSGDTPLVCWSRRKKKKRERPISSGFREVNRSGPGYKRENSRPRLFAGRPLPRGNVPSRPIAGILLLSVVRNETRAARNHLVSACLSRALVRAAGNTRSPRWSSVRVPLPRRRTCVVCGRSFVPLYWVYTAIPAGEEKYIVRPL